jgi:hypothetical protein
MTRSVAIAKEARALWLAWAACLVLMFAAAAFGDSALEPFVLLKTSFWDLGVAAYFFGTVALGAFSMGLEYSHRTLPMFLTQPVGRLRLLLAKALVLAGMLLVVRAVAELLVFSPTGPRLGFVRDELEWLGLEAAMWLPIALAFFVAPWWTMLTRNPIAGTVFTTAVPGLLLLSGELVGWLQGASEAEVERLQHSGLWTGTLAVCALGAVLGPVTFLRLEVIEGHREVRLPPWLRRRTASMDVPTTRHPIWHMVKKELHLQQMTFGVVAFTVAMGTALFSWHSAEAEKVNDVFNAAMVFYTLGTCLLIGSLASAGERQLGTLEWHVMLPVATSKQWLVKVAVVLAVALVTQLGVPAVIDRMSSFDITMGMHFARPEAVVGIIVLTAGSLYVSSLFNTSMQAWLVSLALIPALALFIQTVLVPIAMAPADRPLPPFAIALVLVAAVLAVVLQFALQNHRSAERGAARVAKQVAWIGASLLIATMTWSALAASW